MTPGAAGRTAHGVLVTRPGDQAGELCRLLVEAGLDPVCLPVVETRALAGETDGDGPLRHLDSYDWLALASANAARYLVDRLQALGGGPSTPWPARIAASPAAAQVLAGVGRRASLTVAPFNATRLAAVIAAEAAAGQRVLVPRALQGGLELSQRLRERGLLVEEVALYETVPAAGAQRAAALASHLEDPSLLVLTLFSPSAVQGLGVLAQTAGLGAAQLARLVDRRLVACIGATTARAARDAGWRVDLVPPDTSARSLVDALRQRLDAPVRVPQP